MPVDRNIIQKGWWENEWSQSRHEMMLPGQSDLEPPQAVIEFANFAILHFSDTSNQDISVLDIGSGLGRNSLYLAQRFGRVIGIDYSWQAVEKSSDFAGRHGVNIPFMQADASGTLPLKTGSVNILIDSFTSTSIQGEEKRNSFAKECARILAPKGLLFMRCVSTDDITESMLIATSPGPDENSSIWPGTEKFQKNFTAQEIIDLHSSLRLLSLVRQTKNSFKLGKFVPTTNWTAIFEKAIPEAKNE